jgi:hypothetical protein
MQLLKLGSAAAVALIVSASLLVLSAQIPPETTTRTLRLLVVCR